MIRLPKIDDFRNEVLADDDVDGFKVKMDDFIVDEIAHAEDDVEEDVDLSAKGKSLVTDLGEVIELLAVQVLHQ